MKVDEDALKKDDVFIRAMIRYEVDTALFGVADAWRHLISVDPQAQAAVAEFAEAQKLAELSKGSRTKAH